MISKLIVVDDTGPHLFSADESFKRSIASVKNAELWDLTVTIVKKILERERAGCFNADFRSEEFMRFSPATFEVMKKGLRDQGYKVSKNLYSGVTYISWEEQ